MKYEQPKYEFPVEWRDWCTGAGQPASILWFAGRTWLAGIGSRAERALLAQGAVAVATLRFDPDPLESVHRDGIIDALPPRALLERLLGPDQPASSSSGFTRPWGSTDETRRPGPYSST